MRLCDDKSSQVSRIFLSISVDLYSDLVWIVSTCPLISKSFGPFTNHLGIVSRAKITIGITVTLMFPSFLVLLQEIIIIF